MNFLNDLIKEFKIKGIPMNPCKDEDMENVKKLVGDKTLPNAYIEFLTAMGNGNNGIFLRGDSCYMDELLELNDWAKELLDENNVPQKLTPNDFVFWMSQGCMFCFLKLDEGENPPVYFYSESEKEEGFYKIADTFTEFLHNMHIMDEDTFEKKP